MDPNFDIGFSKSIYTDGVGLIMQVGKVESYISIDSLISQTRQNIAAVTVFCRHPSEFHQRRKERIKKRR